jgi:hypothetical protein
MSGELLSQTCTGTDTHGFTGTSAHEALLRLGTGSSHGGTHVRRVTVLSQRNAYGKTLAHGAFLRHGTGPSTVWRTHVR